MTKTDIKAEFSKSKINEIKKQKLINNLLKSFIWVGFFFIIYVLATSCTLKDQTKKDNEVIIGQVDWKPVSSLQKDDPIYKLSTGVGYVLIDGISRCTGWKVASNKFLTNWHCAKNKNGKITNKDVQKLKISFGYVDAPGNKYYSGKSIVAWSRALDFALIETKKDIPGMTIKLNEKEIVGTKKGFIITQNCDYFKEKCLPIKQFDDSCTFKINKKEITHECDTLGGSSGSPLFYQEKNSDAPMAVGLHFAGAATGKDGRGVRNYAKNTADISKIIKKFLDVNPKMNFIDPNLGKKIEYKYLAPSSFDCNNSGEFSKKWICEAKKWKIIK